MTTQPAEGTSNATSEAIALEHRYGAPNYHPLPVVVADAEGAWVTDVEGKRYLDFLSAYSAINFGHRHPALVQAAKDQLDRVAVTSRAVHSDLLGKFEQRLAEITGMDLVLPMNSGAEAVETAIKAARKWGYDSKGVTWDGARIVVCDNNFHGRTTTIVSFSSDPVSQSGFGPFTPGFVAVAYGDLEALETELAHPDTVAFLVEPVQGEAGVVVPPAGYLQAVRELCDRYNVLLIADEIQTGFGRTGTTFACEHAGIVPDAYLLGKALGGGIVALSAVAAKRKVLSVLTPGTHGSTFGGNPLACAIGLAVLDLVETGEYQKRSKELGAHMHARLNDEAPESVREIRGLGLWAGIELAPDAGPARDYCEKLLSRGIICKDTHVSTIRLAPPLAIELEDLDHAIDEVLAVLAEGRP